MAAYVNQEEAGRVLGYATCFHGCLPVGTTEGIATDNNHHHHGMSMSPTPQLFEWHPSSSSSSSNSSSSVSSIDTISSQDSTHTDTSNGSSTGGGHYNHHPHTTYRQKALIFMVVSTIQ